MAIKFDRLDLKQRRLNQEAISELHNPRPCDVPIGSLMILPMSALSFGNGKFVDFKW